MNFGEAVEVLKEGNMVQRADWQGTLFVFKQIPADIPMRIILNMQLLPERVKKKFLSRYEMEKELTDDSGIVYNEIHYNDQLAIVDVQNVIRGWSPSISDVLAEDWFILK